MRYQVLRITVRHEGRALPLLQLIYDRDRLLADQEQPESARTGRPLGRR